MISASAGLLPSVDWSSRPRSHAAPRAWPGSCGCSAMPRVDVRPNGCWAAWACRSATPPFCDMSSAALGAERRASAGPGLMIVGVDGPRRHRVCQIEVVVVDLRQRRPSVEQISRIGMDTSKHVFQLHGVNAAEAVVLRKKLRRKEMVAFFEKLAPTVIAIEACGARHHWAR